MFLRLEQANFMDPEGILVTQKRDLVMKMGEVEKEYCKGLELALYEM